MPFARPSPRASPSNSLPTVITNSSSPASSYSVTPSLLPGTLATPWNAQAAESQLRAMVEEASSGIAASPGEASSPHITSQALPQILPTLASLPSMNNGASVVSPTVAKPKMSMKQRLFQISDDEADGLSEPSNAQEGPAGKSEKGSETTDDEEDPEVQIRKQREAIARMRAARNEPMRRSISALSGVTVIGKGHSRDREGSASTISSLHSRRSNGSMDSATHLAPSLEQEEDDEQQRRSFPASHASTDNKDRAAMDFKAALDLLHTYPGSSAGVSGSSSTNNSSTRATGPEASGAVHESARPEHSGISQRSRSPSAISSDPSRPTRPRKHSRSSMSDRDRLFGPLSPITPTENLASATSPQSHQTDIEPTTSSANGSFSEKQTNSEVSRKSPRTSRPPSFSSFSFHGSTLQSGRHPYAEPSSRPPMTSRRSSKASEAALAGEGRPISASRSASSADLAQIMRTFHARPRRLPSSRSGRQSEAHSPVLDATDALRRSARSTVESPDIKALIQQKRRQASAPFKTLVASGTISSIASPAGSGPSSPTLSIRDTHSPITMNEDSTFPWHPSPPARRLRSRRNTAALGTLASLSASSTDPSDAFYQARLQALRGVGQVVMTPSVEEWRQLGLSEDLNDRDDSNSSSDSDSSGPSHPRDSEEGMFPSPAVDQTPRPRMGSIQAVNQYYGSLPPREGSWMTRSHTSPELSRSASVRKSRHDDISDISGEGDYSRDKDDDEPSYDAEAYFRRKTSNAVPTLSRGSLSAHTGSPFPGAAPPAPAEIKKALTAHIIQDSLDSTPIKSHDFTRTVSTTRDTSLAPSPNPQLPVLISRSQSPVPLSTTGPMDPRHYSAVTGIRNIDTFAVVSEAGKGAYGLVRKVREIGDDGYPTGPDLMLKYIVKQRILADAYKRHKVLGVIPMEIHVLDYIRKVYRAPAKDPSKSPRLASSNVLGIADPSQINVGHPNLCGMLDFFEDGENYYLVMACFGNGQDLFDYVDMAPTGLSVPEARSILGQITDAVAFLHAHGIVHRDIKDENIILDGKGGVQLIDFGSAAYIKEGKPYFDTFSGTLDFASPEVLRGERYGGKETDIWALGVLAYVILCGECPFWSSEESMAGLAVGSRAEEALRVRADEVEETLAAEAQPQFAQEADAAIDFVHQCLQTHAKNRPSALQLKEHKFLNTQSGWSGFRGWEEAIDADESDGDSN